MRQRGFLVAITVALLWILDFTTLAVPSEPGKIVFLAGRFGHEQIFIMNADGSNIISVAPAEGVPGGQRLALSDDGRKIAFVGGDGHPQIYVVKTDGSNLTRVTLPPAEYWDPAFSPDGRWIAFDTDYDMYYRQIFVVSLDGLHVIRLTNLRGDSFAPAFSPDGRKIAFVSGSDSLQIYMMNADGSGVTRLTNLPGGGSGPVFSPSGRKIAFIGVRDQRIYVMDADGAHASRLLNASATSVSYSPDGLQIVFECGPIRICVMSEDGSNVRDLTYGRAPVFGP